MHHRSASLFLFFAFYFLWIFGVHMIQVHFYLLMVYIMIIHQHQNQIYQIYQKIIAYKSSIKVVVMSVRRMDSTVTDQSRFLLWAFEPYWLLFRRHENHDLEIRKEKIECGRNLWGTTCRLLTVKTYKDNGQGKQ